MSRSVWHVTGRVTRGCGTVPKVPTLPALIPLDHNRLKKARPILVSSERLCYPRSMTVAIYARVSTQDQSCLLQLTELRRYVVARGWEVIGEYVDEHISGIKASRPELDRLMVDAWLHKFDAVLVWKIDRFSRSLQHLLQQCKDLDSAGVRFIVVSQGIDTDKTNPTSRFFMQVLGAVAELERELIRERTTEGRERVRAAGGSLGRPKRIFDRELVLNLHKEGKSFSEIAKRVGISKTLAHVVVRGR
jgi:putative DNA-invertase from lambdoid prophage Rac